MSLRFAILDFGFGERARRFRPVGNPAGHAPRRLGAGVKRRRLISPLLTSGVTIANSADLTASYVSNTMCQISGGISIRPRHRFMKNTIAIIACSLLLFGCGKQQSQQHTSSIGFTAGSTRDAIVKQLEQIHARTLKDSPELVLAEFSTPELKRPMRVELGFADGKLTSVNYIPQ